MFPLFLGYFELLSSEQSREKKEATTEGSRSCARLVQDHLLALWIIRLCHAFVFHVKTECVLQEMPHHK